MLVSPPGQWPCASSTEAPDGVLAAQQVFDDGVWVIFRFGDVLFTPTINTAIER